MDSDQIKGVVVITLPPPDNPSLGKTITAYTFSDSESVPSPEPLHQSNFASQGPESDSISFTHQLNLPISALPSQQNLFSFSKLFTGTPRKLILLLGISLFAIYLYSSNFPNTLQELRNSDEKNDDGPKSFIFPLYSKSGILAENSDVQLKLGRTVGVNKEKLIATLGNVVGVPKLSKSISSTSKLDSSAILPVRGNVYPDGLYYTYIVVGNPPRAYFLDIDTGSDLTWIQCDAPCTSCGKGRNPLYKPKRENIVSFKDSLCMEVQRNYDGDQCKTCHQCDYEIEYADQSSSLGVLMKDEFNLVIANGSLAKLNIIFGDFYQARVVRINYGSSSLSLGAWSSKPERVVFDSGSSYTYFTKESYSQLVASLEKVSTNGLIKDSSDTICWKTEFPIRSVQDVKHFFKPVTLQFGSRLWIVSTKLEIPPENYLVISKEGNVCLGILDGSQVHDGSTIILGDNSLRGKLIVYDNVNQKIGWTSSDCQKPKRIKSLPNF